MPTFVDLSRATGVGGCTGQGDSDIAGLGVLFAFLVTAFGTNLLAWVGYLFRAVDNNQSPLDELFLKWFWVFTKNHPRLPRVWAQVLRDLTFMLSDQLIITDITTLVAGYIKSSSISFYHFQIVTYLAWLASGTHRTALTVWRGFLRERRHILIYRVAVMTVIFFMLFVAICFSGFEAY